MRVRAGEGGEAAELSLSSDADEYRDPRAYLSSCAPPPCHGIARRRRGYPQPAGYSATRTLWQQTPPRRSPVQCLAGARQGEASPPLAPMDVQSYRIGTDCCSVCKRVVFACVLATEVSTRLALRVTAMPYSPSVKKREEPVSALGLGLRPLPTASVPTGRALSSPVGYTSTTSILLLYIVV